MVSQEFDHRFASLTGNAPFPWQRALYARLVAGDIPANCDLPTGLGKTSVIAVWLLARAAGARLPRRLVYVVNRRTVVDQTTEEILRVRERLGSIGVQGELAVSTLRGQMADNRAWSADPSQQAVISGTVDMIGSRLLFSGYRIGFRARPMHAGFLGQDALLVHDEAHLEPAFQQLVEAIQAEQARSGDPWPLRVMALTATSRSGGSDFQLGPEDARDPVVAKRLRATKRLHLHPHAEKNLGDLIMERALTYRSSGRAVVVFLRRVDDVMALVARLRKAGLPVQQLTGTMRGLERDRLVLEDPVFRRFLPTSDAPPGAPGTTVYLVCTSAGEVGVNISADDLLCDLSTFDSMAQRFGRLNRFGLRDDSEAHVFHPEPEALAADESPEAARRGATLELLRLLDGDASPAALGSLDPVARRNAFAPEPRLLQPTDILFDAWAATTVTEDLPGRPPVEPYLHGVAPWEPPTTQVAWRTEVGVITEHLLARYPAQELIDDYPLKPHELLTDRTSRVLDSLDAVARRLTAPDKAAVWLVDEGGHVQPRWTLAALLADDRKSNEQRLAGCTVILSPKDSGPASGMLSAEGAAPASPAGIDVADEWYRTDGERLRARVLGEHAPPKGMRVIRALTLRDDDVAEEEGEAAPAADERPSEAATWTWYELPSAADNDGSRSASRAVLLEVHGGDVGREAEGIVKGLALDTDLKQAVVTAARLHDIGKSRRVWQRSIGNTDRERLLAKSGAKMRPLELTAYRHELGSMLDAEAKELLRDLSPAVRELALHLIAAHHGRARPHFPARELFDPETRGIDFETVGTRVLTRFARLQKRFGRWGLAYLESLVRAADYAASARPSKVEEA